MITTLTAGSFCNVYAWSQSTRDPSIKKCVIKISHDVKRRTKEPLLNEDFFLRYFHQDIRISNYILKRAHVLKFSRFHPMFGSSENFGNRIGLVVESFRQTLREYLDLNESGLGLNQIQVIMRQITKVLCFLEEKGLLYSDLSLENTFISSEGKHIKLGDFEQVCFKNHANCVKWANRPFEYTSPQLLLEVIDRSETDLTKDAIWALGIITAELFTKLRFLGRRDHIMSAHQRLLGNYPESLVAQGSKEGRFFFQLSCLLPCSNSDSLEGFIRKTCLLKREDENKGEAILDLFYKMFCYESKHRISAEDVLRHPFVGEEIWPKPPRITSSSKLNYSRVKLTGILGKGAFGSVFEGHIFNEKEEIISIALKSIKCSQSDSCGFKVALNSFYKEFSVSRLLEIDERSRHFFVPCLDFTIRKGQGFLAYELMGDNFHTYAKKNSLSLEKIKKFTRQILQGLCVLSDYKIVHRDLKPANILVSEGGESVKLADFGLASFEDPGCSYIGTRCYRDPEIALLHQVKKESDVWSAGVVLAEIITKKSLFLAKSEAELIARHESALKKKYSAYLIKRASFWGKTTYDKSEQLQLDGASIFENALVKEARAEVFLESAFEFDPSRRLFQEHLLQHLFLA